MTKKTKVVLIKLLFYFLAGGSQWAVATLRTWFIAQKQVAIVSFVVFIEEILLVAVSAYVILHPKQWYLLLSGAFGGAVGAYVCMILVQ